MQRSSFTEYLESKISNPAIRKPLTRLVNRLGYRYIDKIYEKFYLCRIQICKPTPPSRLFSVARGVSSTHSGCLSHKIHTPCSANQSRSPILDSSSRKSKCQRTLARIRRISAYASCRPIQLRGPMLNGCEASRRSLANSGSPSHR